MTCRGQDAPHARCRAVSQCWSKGGQPTDTMATNAPTLSGARNSLETFSPGTPGSADAHLKATVATTDYLSPIKALRIPMRRRI